MPRLVYGVGVRDLPIRSLGRMAPRSGTLLREVVGHADALLLHEVQIEVPKLSGMQRRHRVAHLLCIPGLDDKPELAGNGSGQRFAGPWLPGIRTGNMLVPT